MTFWPWPNLTRRTPGSRATHGASLVYVGSRVNELLQWPWNDLRSNFWTFMRFDLKWPFDLDLTPSGEPQGQGLPMVQVWSMWGQGLKSYCSDLEMTLDDLRLTLNNFGIWPWNNILTFNDLDHPPSFAVQVWPEPLHVTKFHSHSPYGSQDMLKNHILHKLCKLGTQLAYSALKSQRDQARPKVHPLTKYHDRRAKGFQN